MHRDFKWQNKIVIYFVKYFGPDHLPEFFLKFCADGYKRMPIGKHCCTISFSAVILRRAFRRPVPRGPSGYIYVLL